MSDTRVYVVTDKGTEKAPKAEYLVRAKSPGQAERHKTAPRFESRLANQDDLVRLLTIGIVVEEAANGSEPPAE